MRLVSLELNNIRSHKQTRIDFRDGVTLFEGDIGCGKSTLLYAIEFALFGLGDLQGDFLLRHDASEGSVKLKMNSGGRDYEFYRSLERKKGGAVQQGVAAVTEEGVRSDYAPAEMKPQVLKILGFNESPSPKSTSWIYRYAVFTPQEEMKRVLELKDEERMQTLRKAFGVEEYKIARENSGVAAKAFRERERFFEGELQDLDSLTKEKGDAEEEKSVLAGKAAVKSGECMEAEKSVSESKTVLEKIRGKTTALEKTKAEIPLITKRIEDKKREKSAAEKELERLRREKGPYEVELNELRGKEKRLEGPDEKNALQESLELRKKISETSQEIGALSAKLLEYEELLSKKMCPTCGQPLSGTGFEGKANYAKERLGFKELELKELQARQETLDAVVREAQEQAGLKRRIADVIKWLENSDSRAEDLKKKIADALAEIPGIEEELNAKKAVLSESAELEAEFAEAKKRSDAAEAALREKIREKSQAEAELKACEKRLADFEKKISEKLSVKEKLSDVNAKRLWLNEFFEPTLSAIEQQVLAAINAEFDSLFQKYFALLIEEGDLSVRASESFAPLIEQDGFEQDYRALSGGEKSALALAYRLALNAVVRRVSASLEENLLILDEPTDGFSKEQLARVREVLDEVGARQVLLVSHERELEAFADAVERIEKKGGESSIVAANPAK